MHAVVAMCLHGAFVLLQQTSPKNNETLVTLRGLLNRGGEVRVRGNNKRKIDRLDRKEEEIGK